MKPTGIIRRIDDLGRVVIPKDIRRTMGLREGDPLEIFISDEGGVIFLPYRTSLAHDVRAMKDRISTELVTGNSIREEQVMNYLEEAARLIEKLEGEAD